MHYLFKYTYNPEQANLDKVRKSCIVEADDVMAAIGASISKLEIADEISEGIISEYLDAIGDEDTSDGWEWQIRDTNGIYTFEWRPFEAADQVTINAIHEWVLQVIGDSTDQLQPFLVALMGRWSWRVTSWCDKGELQEQLHQIMMEGSGKGFCEMTVVELLEEVKNGPMQAAIDNYEIGEGEPFGISVMVKRDRELWLELGRVMNQGPGPATK